MSNNKSLNMSNSPITTNNTTVNAKSNSNTGFGFTSNNSSGSNSGTGSDSGSLMNSGKDFLESNTFISKVVIIILIIIFFIFLFRIGLEIINYFMFPARSPILIPGMINGNNSYIIEVNPNKKDSIPIYRSNNENNGIEFTYNSWIFIDDIFRQKEKYQHIWHKGDDVFDNQPPQFPGISYPNNCPGVYIKPNGEDLNALSIFINTYDSVLEEVVIENIPISKWICLTIRVQNKSLDVYFNGTLIRRHELTGIPRQNYGNIYCAQQGGFGGYLSKLQYWDYAISYNTIANVVRKGPDLNIIGENTDVNPPYLAMRWYFDEMQYFTQNPFIPN